MPRSALPQNYQIHDPIWTEGFEDLSSWTKGGDAEGIAEADTENFKEGSQSLVMRPVTDWPGVTFTKTVDLDLSSLASFTYWIYTPEATYGSLEIDFSPDANVARKMSIAESLHTSGFEPRGKWIRKIFSKSDFTVVGNTRWDDHIIRVFIRLVGGSVPRPRPNIDGFRADARFIPKCVVMFDDTHDTDYTVAFPYMSARNIPGTCYLNSDNVGAPGRCTLSQIQTMYDAGWAICGHTASHTIIAGLPLDEQEYYISTTQDYLEQHGLTRCKDYFTYPNNSADDVSFQACANRGIVCARAGGNALTGLPVDNKYYLPSYAVQHNTTVSTVIAWINKTIATGHSIFLFFHSIVENPPTYQCDPAVFRGVIDYLYNMRPLIKCVTIDEWYNGLTNPRYRSLPMR